MLIYTIQSRSFACLYRPSKFPVNWIYAILTRVNSNQYIWEVWADSLHRWGLKDLIAVILDATGPLNLLGAQVVYFSQPFFSQVLPAGHWDALADVLENPAKTQAFTAYLRQMDQSI